VYLLILHFGVATSRIIRKALQWFFDLQTSNFANFKLGIIYSSFAVGNDVLLTRENETTNDVIYYSISYSSFCA